MHLCYLDIDKKFPEVSRGHDNGGIELNNIALVQSDVMVSCQSLKRINTALLTGNCKDKLNGDRILYSLSSPGGSRG